MEERRRRGERQWRDREQEKMQAGDRTGRRSSLTKHHTALVFSIFSTRGQSQGDFLLGAQHGTVNNEKIEFPRIECPNSGLTASISLSCLPLSPSLPLSSLFLSPSLSPNESPFHSVCHEYCFLCSPDSSLEQTPLCSPRRCYETREDPRNTVAPQCHSWEP